MTWTVLCRLHGRDHRLVIRADSHGLAGDDREFRDSAGRWIARVPARSIVAIRQAEPIPTS